MNFKTATAAVLAFGLFAAGSLAQAEIDPGMAFALVQRAHVAAGLEGVAPQLKSAFAAQARQAPAAPGSAMLSDSEVAALLGAIEHAYRTDRMLQTITQAVSEMTSADDLPTINQWFASPSSRAIDAAEERALGDARAQQSRMSDGVAALQRATPQRRALIVELVRCTRAADVMSDMALSTAAAVISGLSAATPGARPVSIDDVKRSLKDSPARRGDVERAARVIAARKYENVTDADLRNFVAFLHTEQGDRFYNVMVSSVAYAMTLAGVDLGREMGRIGRQRQH